MKNVLLLCGLIVSVTCFANDTVSCTLNRLSPIDGEVERNEITMTKNETDKSKANFKNQYPDNILVEVYYYVSSQDLDGNDLAKSIALNVSSDEGTLLSSVSMGFKNDSLLSNNQLTSYVPNAGLFILSCYSTTK